MIASVILLRTLTHTGLMSTSSFQRGFWRALSVQILRDLIHGASGKVNNALLKANPKCGRWHGSSTFNVCAARNRE